VFANLPHHTASCGKYTIDIHTYVYSERISIYDIYYYSQIKFATKEVEELYTSHLAKISAKKADKASTIPHSSSSSAPQNPDLDHDASSSKTKKSKKGMEVESADATNLDVYENYTHPPPAPFLQTNEAKHVKTEFFSRGLAKAFTFKCPYHMCHNCYPLYGNNGTFAPELKCAYCPRAYHENCLPPRARFNTLILACSLHSDITLPHEKSVKALSTAESTKMQGDVDYPKVFGDVILQKNPKATDSLDLHYRLPSEFPDDIKAEPRPFKTITRLKYDLINLSEMPLNHTDEVCSCKEHCGPSCFNRQVKVECNDNICNLGSKCGNRRLQNMEYAKTIRFPEFEMGWGLKAGEFIKDDSLVIEYIGEVIDRDEMKRRMFNQRQNTPSDKDYYIMALGK